MTDRSRITQDQVVAIATYVHRNREELEQLNASEAMEVVASETGITFSKTSYDKIREELEINHPRKSSVVERGLRQFKKSLDNGYVSQK